MSFNKPGSAVTSTGPAKKSVPNFLQKKKEAAQNIGITSPQMQNAPTIPFSSPQSTAQKANQQLKQKSTLNPKDVNVQIEQKEIFPQLQKVREKDSRQLDVNIQKCKEVYDFYERKGRNELPVKGKNNYSPKYNHLAFLFTNKLELGNALRSLGYLVSTKEIRELQEKLQKQIKANNQVVATFIEFKDFLVAVHLVQHKLPNERELQSALSIFDKSNTGSINKDMLKGVLTKIGDIIPEKEFDSLFSTLYTDQNGNIPMQYILGTLLKYPQA